MAELKINDKPISEFKDVGELAKALGERLDRFATALQETIRKRHGFASGFTDWDHATRYSNVTRGHVDTLEAIDKLFGTDYSSMKSIYASKKAEG